MDKDNNAADWVYPHEILGHAEEFRKAALRLKDGVSVQSSIVMPSCVCAALSIELYFKFLIFAKNRDLNELKAYRHRIFDLYENIPADWQREILDSISHTISEKDLVQALEYFNDAFEIWRYVYEYNKITTSTQLHLIADLLSVECKRINSDVLEQEYLTEHTCPDVPEK